MTRRPPTLFLRLLLLTLPVECVVLALFGIWLIRGSERREQAAFDERLRIQSQAVLSGVGLDATGMLRFSGDLSTRALGGDARGCLLDEKSTVLWEFPSGWFEASGIRALSMSDVEYVHSLPVGGAWFRVIHSARRVQRPQDTGEATGPLVEVVLSKPLAALVEANLELRKKAVAVGLALLALTALLLWVAIGAGLKPLKAMMRRLSEVPGPAGTERLDENLVPAELRPLAREINGLLDRLWGLVQMERRFAAEAAHELRTPLTLVKSTLQTALLTAREKEDYAGALQEALEDLLRLEATAESLLVLSRADALFASEPSPFGEVHLDDLLRAVAERFTPAAAQRDLRVTLALSPGAIFGERDALERLFINLVDNAVKYSGPGGTITLRCDIEDAAVVAAVEDTGPVIPAADRPNLFEQFFRGSSGRAAQGQGAGLGLSIARAMARLHGAKLSFEPTGRGGNRFIVRFPSPS